MLTSIALLQSAVAAPHADMTFTTEEIGGWTVRTARAHTPDRPTVLLTNALPQSIRCWESHWDGLAEHFDVLAVDLPGFGMSSGSGEIMRPSAQADFLAALMDAHGIEQAFVVGPDIGAPVALWLAAEHPERVLGVNVFDGPGTWPPDFDSVLRTVSRSGLVRWLGRTLLRGQFMAQNAQVATSLGYQRYTPSPAAQAEYQQIAADRVKNANALDYIGSYAEELPLLEAMLPTIQAPVLITWGAEDTFVPPTNAQKLHALLPNSEVTIFEGAGHFSHEDAGDAWLARFVSFTDAQLAQL